MKGLHRYLARRRVPAFLACAALGLATSGCAARNESVRRPAVLHPSAIEAVTAVGDEATPRGQSEGGIKVHGHWILAVRNPDGSLAIRREFENSLQVGARTLAGMLSRSSSVGLWAVDAGYNGVSGPCIWQQNGNVPSPCTSAEPGYPVINSTISQTLTVSAPFRPDPNAGKLILSGTFTVQNASPINIVSSSVNACLPNVPPSTCVGGSMGVAPGASFFSSTILSPVNVVVGQVVQITVVFSFS